MLLRRHHQQGQGKHAPMSDTQGDTMITEEVRAETVARLTQAQEKFAPQLALIDCLERHRIMESDNLGYYRSRLHCSCAAEWWAGSHQGDPSYEDMWAIHLAEVAAGFMADRASSDAGGDS
jgi:hypothetical protein